MFDRASAPQQESARARADRHFEGSLRNECVDEVAVQRFGDPPKRSQLDAPFLFGSLKVNDARLAHTQPLGELRRAHPKGLPDRLYPPPLGGTVSIGWSELGPSLVEAGTRLS